MRAASSASLRRALAVLAVEPIERSSVLRCCGVADAARACAGAGSGCVPPRKQRALVGGRQEAVAPGRRAALDPAAAGRA